MSIQNRKQLWVASLLFSALMLAGTLSFSSVWAQGADSASTSIIRPISRGEQISGNDRDKVEPKNEQVSQLGEPKLLYQQVVAGVEHTCALTRNGGVKCWGNNRDGQLGNATYTKSKTPVDVQGLDSDVQAITVGNNSTCALTHRGGLKCWGDNREGQLGEGSIFNHSTAIDVQGLTSNVAAISMSSNHACALTRSGGVKCWGDNSEGQLGDGTTFFRLTPVDVQGLNSDVAAISVSKYHSCALTRSSAVKCWGFNVMGQLGDGSTTSRNTPVEVKGLANDVAAISTGLDFTCALSRSGGVKCWGLNVDGQIGDASTTSRHTPVDVQGLASDVAAISSGLNYNCALTHSGGVKCWGLNRYGQLGDGSTTSRNTPVDVPGLSSDIKAITAGENHTCALTNKGAVKCWGLNLSGQLGDGTKTSRNTPVDVMGLSIDVEAIKVGRYHTCALTISGEVKCWGANN